MFLPRLAPRPVHNSDPFAEAEHIQTLADSRSRLELFLEEHTRSGGPEGPTTLEIDLDDVRGEFGDIVSDPSSDSYEADSRADSATENRGEIGREAAGAGQEKEALKWEEFEDVAYGADGECFSKLPCRDFRVSLYLYSSLVYFRQQGRIDRVSCALLRFQLLVGADIVHISYSSHLACFGVFSSRWLVPLFRSGSPLYW